MPNFAKLVEAAKRNLEEKAAQKKISPQQKEMILKFIKQISAEGLSKNRQRKYLYMLGNIAIQLKKPFEDTTKNDVVNLVDWINTKYDSEETKRDYRVAIKRIIKYAQEQQGKQFEDKEYPQVVKWLKSSCKKENKILPKQLLTENDIITLADFTKNLRDRAFVLLLYETGGRISEILDLKVKDLNLEKDKRYATVDLHGKTGSRVLPIVFSYPALSNWFLEHPRKKDANFKESFVFCGIGGGKRYGKQMNYDYVRKLLSVLAKRANIQKPSNPHHYRHSRATYLATKFTDAQLKQYFGWGQSSRQASTYIHLSGRDLNDAVLKLHGLKTKEEFETMMKTQTCPRCGNVNDPSMKYCGQCSLGLDEKTVFEFQQKKEQLAETGMILEKTMGKEQLDQLIREHIIKILRENEDKK